MTPGTGTALWRVSAESQKVTSFCLVAKTRPKIDLSRIRLSVWGLSLPVFVRAWPGPGASGPAPSPSGHFCLLLWSGTKRSKHLDSPAVFPCTLGPFPSFPGPLLHFRERPPSFGSLSPGMRGESTFPRFGSPSQGALGSVSVCRRSALGCSGALLRVFRASSLWGRLSFCSLGYRRDCLPPSLCSCTGSVALLSRDSALLPPLLEWKVLLISSLLGVRHWADGIAGISTCSRRSGRFAPLVPVPTPLLRVPVDCAGDRGWSVGDPAARGRHALSDRKWLSG